MMPTTSPISPTAIDAGSSPLPTTTAGLSQLFSTLPVPGAGEINGSYRGKLQALRILDTFSKHTREPLLSLCALFVSPLLYHQIETNRGTSQLPLSAHLTYGDFKVDVATSFADEKPLLRLGYDCSGNPPLVRSRVDEVRRLEDGRYLVQLCYQGVRGVDRIAFYTLEAC